jgi:hypothetical protein
MSSAKVLDGRVVLYGVSHWYEGRQDIFEPKCFAGSLDMIWFGIEHKYSERPLGCQEDGSLELHDDDVALHFRLKLTPDALERLDGRNEASAAYSVRDSEIRDGVRYIKSAILMEISACHVASLRQSHCIVRDADSVGKLTDDARRGFASDAAGQKFLNALKRLEST